MDNNSDYWIKKAKENFTANENASNEAVMEMFHSLEEVALEIEDKINAFYNKYAEDNNMTLKQAKKMISSKEYSVWKKSLDDYMLDINSTTIPNNKILLELNTLSTKSQISREEKLLADIYLQMLELASEQEEDLSKVLEGIISTNYSKSISNLKASSTALSGDFVSGKLDKKALSSILNHKWSAKTFSKAIWDNVTNMVANLKRIITKGFASGSSVQKMVRELKELTQKEKYVVERLVRTECKYFANQSELIAYKENGIKKYVFMGGTEGSISCKCKDYNNKIFNVDDAEVGVNFPPLHPNCKCCIRAYFENSILNNNQDTSLFEDEQTQENDLNNKSIDDIIKETDFYKLENVETADGLVIQSISKHFKERAIEREVEIDAIKDSLINPVLIGDIKHDKNNNPSKEYFGEKARTQVNPITNNLITTWKMSSKKLDKIRRKLENENKLE